MATIGFQADLQIKDGVSDAWVTVAAQVMIALPGIEVGEQEVTGLNQKIDDDPEEDPDFVRRYIPTLHDIGTLKCEAYFTKATYLRLVALAGLVEDYKLISPEDDAAATLTASGKGFLKKIDDVTFEKDVPTKVKFEIRRSKAWTNS